MKRLTYSLLLLVALLGALAVACGGDEDDATPSSTATTAATTAATASATSTPFPAGSTMAKIVANKRLTVGVKFDQPGFGVKDPVSGKSDGFDIAMAKEIAKALGLTEDQITYTEAVSANRIPYLKEDKVDIVIATMTITDARKLEIDFSRPYFKAGQSILVKKDNSTIKSVTDLNGKKACSVSGSTSETNVKAKAPQVELLNLDGYAACVASLKDGRVEAVTTDDIILAGFAKTDSTLKLVGGAFTAEPYGIGFKKGKDDFVAFVNTLLNDMLKDGRWDKAYNQYLGGIEGLPTAADARAALPAN